jgi:transcriptional regulator with GAF, ATPase, and Fis domain
VIRSNNGVLANPFVVSEKLSDPPVPAPSAFSDSQRALILQALQETGWVIGGSCGAAARLGLKRTTLIAKMKKLGISRPVTPDHGNELTDSFQGEPALS